MANSLLDFVMSLVRDPDVAAAYAADPAQTIADANLTGVTSADVSNLIPVVTESLSMGSPGSGAPVHEPAANVWASGAATAAFDAFDSFGDYARHETVDSVAPDARAIATDPVDQPDHSLAALDDLHDLDISAGADIDDTPIGYDHPAVDDGPVGGQGDGHDWGTFTPDHPDAHGAGLDFFD